MSLAVILPSCDQKDAAPATLLSRLLSLFRARRGPLETHSVEIFDDLTLVVCNIRTPFGYASSIEKRQRKIKRKLEELFAVTGVWSVLEHPAIGGLFDSGRERYESVRTEVAVNRFTEILKVLKGVGRLSEKEVTITGPSTYLEYAIAKLITSVRIINILLPEGSEEPEEADLAFEETGIPVHITCDPEVLIRTSLWIRFPNDHESFDALPAGYEGAILDLGALKVINTKTRTIRNISVDLSEEMGRKIGCDVTNALDSDRLSGFLIAYGTNAWGKSAADVSVGLGMTLSLKP